MNMGLWLGASRSGKWGAIPFGGWAAWGEPKVSHMIGTHSVIEPVTFFGLMVTPRTHWNSHSLSPPVDPFKVHLSWPLSLHRKRNQIFPVLLTININSNFISVISPFYLVMKLATVPLCSLHRKKDFLPSPEFRNNFLFLVGSGLATFSTFLNKLLKLPFPTFSFSASDYPHLLRMWEWIAKKLPMTIALASFSEPAFCLECSDHLFSFFVTGSASLL